MLNTVFTRQFLNGLAAFLGTHGIHNPRSGLGQHACGMPRNAFSIGHTKNENGFISELEVVHDHRVLETGVSVNIVDIEGEVRTSKFDAGTKLSFDL